MAEIKRYICGSFIANPSGSFVTHSDHIAALKAAVEKEREACAKLCDSLYQDSADSADCAYAIRARKEPT